MTGSTLPIIRYSAGIDVVLGSLEQRLTQAARPVLSGHRGDVVVGDVAGPNPDRFTDAVEADVADARCARVDAVTACALLTSTVTQDHVDLHPLVQAEADLRREQVAKAQDLLAGVLQRGDDADPRPRVPA